MEEKQNGGKDFEKMIVDALTSFIPFKILLI